MKKLLKIRCLLLLGAVSVLLVWGKDFVRCEYLTYKYGGEFTAFDEVSTASQYKVLKLEDDFARIYCVNAYKTSGTVHSYIKEDGKWKHKEWENGGWSVSGTADGIVWPYCWHTFRAFSPFKS